MCVSAGQMARRGRSRPGMLRSPKKLLCAPGTTVAQPGLDIANGDKPRWLLTKERDVEGQEGVGEHIGQPGEERITPRHNFEIAAL